MTGGLFTNGTNGSATVTRNNGSENVAVFGLGGGLDFYWQDSAGDFLEEIVATTVN